MARIHAAPTRTLTEATGVIFAIGSIVGGRPYATGEQASLDPDVARSLIFDGRARATNDDDPPQTVTQPDDTTDPEPSGEGDNTEDQE